MNSKDKENLSYLYELDQFKSLVKLVTQMRRKVADKLLVMPIDEREMAFLQGQAYSVDSLLKKIKELHKQSMKD